MLRPSHSRDRFERSLHDELEPTTVASGKASGTAKLRGAAASAVGSSSHDDAPTNEKDGYFSKVFNQYAVLLLTLLIPGVPLTKIFVQVAMDSASYSCFDVVAMLYLGAAVNALSSFVGVLYLCAKDTKGAASTTILGTAANTALSVALVPFVGLMGAALGNLVGNAAILAARLRQTRKYCALRVRWVEFLCYAALVVASSLMTAALPSLGAVAVFTVVCLLVFVIVNFRSAKALLGFAKLR